MIYIQFIIHWYVVLIHFIMRSIIIEFADFDKLVALFYRTEMKYLKWESRGVLTLYLMPWLCFFILGKVMFWIMFVLCIFVAAIRSYEHIEK